MYMMSIALPSMVAAMLGFGFIAMLKISAKLFICTFFQKVSQKTVFYLFIFQSIDSGAVANTNKQSSKIIPDLIYFKNSVVWIIL